MVNFLFSWIQKHKHKILDAGVMLVPVVACVLFALFQGKWLGDYYLPESSWNDELLYFKQIEGVVQYGKPQGYFGYNESSAQNMTFGAWSPLIMVLYMVWGFLMNWNYSAPIICNIFLISVGFTFFVHKAQLQFIQKGMMAAFLVLFLPLSRFMLSCMADCEMIAILMVYMGFYIDMVNKKEQNGLSAGNFCGMIICGVLLTLMRPYFLLLFVIPVICWFRKNKVVSLFAGLLAVGSVIAYFAIGRMFTAAYIYPLIKTEWIETIFYSPLGGVKNAILQVVDGIGEILKQCGSGIVSGNMEGTLWVLYLVVFVIILCLSIKNKRYRIWSFMLVALLGAVIMFYDIKVGSRHLVPFIVAIVLLLCCSEYKKTAICVLVGVALVFTCRIGADSYNYSLPVYDETRENTIVELKEVLEGAMEIQKTQDYWDNTVIWLFYDETMLDWQALYALPGGVGINLCMPDYVIDRMDELKARYIAVNTGERIDKMLAETSARIITEQGGITIWELRK